MFCNKCGSKLQEGAAFCNACGAKVNPTIQQPIITPYNANIQATQSNTSFLGGLPNTLTLTTVICVLHFIYAIVWTLIVIQQLDWLWLTGDTLTVLWNSGWTIVSYVIAFKLLFARRCKPLDLNLLYSRIKRYTIIALVGVVYYGWVGLWLVFVIDLAIVVLSVVVLVSFSQLGVKDKSHESFENEEN